MTCLCLFSAQVWSYLLALILHGELVLIPGNSSLQGTRYIHGLAFSFLAFFCLLASSLDGGFMGDQNCMYMSQANAFLFFLLPLYFTQREFRVVSIFYFIPLDDLCCFNFFMLVVVVGGAAVVVKMILSGLRYLYLKYWEGAQKNANNITMSL